VLLPALPHCGNTTGQSQKAQRRGLRNGCGGRNGGSDAIEGDGDRVNLQIKRSTSVAVIQDAEPNEANLRQTRRRQVEPGATTGDFLQGFLRGTRSALSESGRENMTISIPTVNAYYLGSLIALFERAVSFYASLVNINAYHQPGVEAGKKAAGSFLEVLKAARGFLAANAGADLTTADVAKGIDADVESTYHALVHAATNASGINHTMAATPEEDTFSLEA